jgi:uncharacterized protein (TIGR02145 family)
MKIKIWLNAIIVISLFGFISCEKTDKLKLAENLPDVSVNADDHSGEKGTVTDIDGNIYKTIGIGSQIWMAENLRTTHLNDSAEIIYGQCPRCWAYLTTPGYCWYDNFVANENVFGALYNWYTVSSMRICPTGWHVPSSDEWDKLESYLGSGILAGSKLIESGNSEFEALSGGYRGELAMYYNSGQTGNFWTSLSVLPGKALTRVIDSKSMEIKSESIPVGWGASVRCIKN